MTSARSIRNQAVTALAAAGVVLVVFWAKAADRNQSSVVGTVKNFKVSPEFYPAPNNRQMKSLLEGSEATPQPDGRIVVRNARLQTFREDGRKELGVETPECTYDPALLSISSPATLRAFTTDGKFAMEGTGFLWRQTNSSLLISNKVSTVLQPEMLESGPATEQRPSRGPQLVRIQSDSFGYEAEAGQGRYLGNVAVLGTNLSLSAGVLSFQLPFEERQLRSITAENDVVVDYESIHATGGHAIYTTADEQLRVTRQPTWRADSLEGSARELIIDRTNQVFRALGDAYASLPGQGLQTFSFVASNTVPRSTSGQDRSIQIRSDFYELRTNLAVFGNQVQLTDMLAGEAQGGMTCSNLQVAFAGTNRLERLVADGNVIISQGDFQLRSSRTEYSETNGILLAEGNPEWRAGERRGSGDIIKVDTRKEEMRVEGNGSMRMPAEDLGRATLPEALRSQAPLGGSGELAEIFSEDYSLQRQQARFLGGVYISHPRMAWACETLTVNMATNTVIEEIVADEKVAFDLMVTEQQPVRGRAGRALYQYRVTPSGTNDVIRLTGSPILETTNMLFQNSIFIIDRAQQKLIAPGRYRLRGSAGDFDTNLLQIPDFKALREGRRKR